MTAEQRFSVAMRDLADVMASVEVESVWRHPVDRLRVVMFRDEAARLRATFEHGDAAVRANLARAAESLTREAQQAFTTVIDASTTTAAPARPAPSFIMHDLPQGSFFPQLVAGGLVAVGVVSGAIMISAAIRGVGGAHYDVEEYAQFDGP
jgi:hypothetical protein